MRILLRNFTEKINDVILKNNVNPINSGNSVFN